MWWLSKEWGMMPKNMKLNNIEWNKTSTQTTAVTTNITKDLLEFLARRQDSRVFFFFFFLICTITFSRSFFSKNYNCHRKIQSHPDLSSKYWFSTLMNSWQCFDLETSWNYNHNYYHNYNYVTIIITIIIL